MAERKINFTKRELESLPLPEQGKKVRYQDTKTHGLTVLVTGGGSKTFYVYRRIKGTLYEERIGPFPEIGVEEARRMAEGIIAGIHRGQDPKETRRKSKTDPTFSELFEWYLETHAFKKKDGGHRNRAQFRLYLHPLANKKAGKITRTEVLALHDKISASSGAATANRAISLLRSVYNFALDREAFSTAVTANPARKIRKAEEGDGRERRLEHREIGPFLKAVAADHHELTRDLLLVALFTGARRANVLGMRWDQIDTINQAWHIPAGEFKSGEPHVIPLPKDVLDILARRREMGQGEFVFPGRSRKGTKTSPYHALKRVLERAEIRGFTFHDLRRTCATYMGEAGVDQSLIGLVLGHSQPSVTGRYNRPGLEAKRDALEKGIALMKAKAGLDTIKLKNFLFAGCIPGYLH